MRDVGSKSFKQKRELSLGLLNGSGMLDTGWSTLPLLLFYISLDLLGVL